jgi:hypothetical protein
MVDCEGEKMRRSVATNLALENRYNNMQYLLHEQ